MRFRRGDLPGFLIAVGAPPLLFILFLASYETWGHRGTPLLGIMSSNIAFALAVPAVFTRFVRNWDVPLGFLLLLAAAAGGVIWAQRSGADGTTLATALKWIGVLAFFGLNAAIGVQVLLNGLMPMLDRRAAARRSQS
jgi:hypothetical protein